MKKKQTLLWSLVLLLIFLLSQDYFFISWSGRPNILGLPDWIFWFALVHILFIGSLYWFTKKHH